LWIDIAWHSPLDKVVRLPRAARITTMQIDRRFADYGLTGGFFLICQLGLLWRLEYWPEILNQFQALRLPSDTSLLAPIITGFAGAFALIAVFVTGLILDLVASLLRGVEMRVFFHHLNRNSAWLTGLIDGHEVYCKADYETFQRGFQTLLSASFQRRLIYMFTPWRRESRLFYVDGILSGGWGREYNRLLSFFTSYITVQSGSTQLTMLADQYALWRTARAIATALYLISMEVLLFVVGPRTREALGIWLFPTSYLCLAIALYLVLATYSRLCFTLFSLVYVAYDKQIVSRKVAKPAP
jgi:hypothetical protein